MKDKEIKYLLELKLHLEQIRQFQCLVSHSREFPLPENLKDVHHSINTSLQSIEFKIQEAIRQLGTKQQKINFNERINDSKSELQKNTSTFNDDNFIVIDSLKSECNNGFSLISELEIKEEIKDTTSDQVELEIQEANGQRFTSADKLDILQSENCNNSCRNPALVVEGGGSDIMSYRQGQSYIPNMKIIDDSSTKKCQIDNLNQIEIRQLFVNQQEEMLFYNSFSQMISKNQKQNLLIEKLSRQNHHQQQQQSSQSQKSSHFFTPKNNLVNGGDFFDCNFDMKPFQLITEKDKNFSLSKDSQLKKEKQYEQEIKLEINRFDLNIPYDIKQTPQCFLTSNLFQPQQLKDIEQNEVNEMNKDTKISQKKQTESISQGKVDEDEKIYISDCSNQQIDFDFNMNDKISKYPPNNDQYLNESLSKQSLFQNDSLRNYIRGPYNFYSENLKKKAINDYYNLKDIKKAADLNHVKAKNLKRWISVGHKRKEGGGRKKEDPQMEDQVHEWLSNQYNKQGIQATRNQIRKKALQLSNKKEKFKASKGWLEKFFQRYKCKHMAGKDLIGGE